MPIKDNDDRVSDLLKIITKSCARYIFSLYNFFQRQVIQILSESFLESMQRCIFSLCALLKTIKPNVFPIPFRGQYSVTGMPLL